MKIQVITANNGWFIREIKPANHYDPYGFSIRQCYFNGKLPETTFSKEWFCIEPNATYVQKKIPSRRINERYELKDLKFEINGYAAVLSTEEYNDKTDDTLPDRDPMIGVLYEFKYDLSEETFEDVEVEFEYIFNYNGDLVEPSISFEGAQAYDTWMRAWKNTLYSSSAVQHQMIDKIVFPDILLHECPASFTSEQMYDITRNYIKSHINPDVAEITSDYDFCFEVKKKVKRITPEVYTYYNIFARTKRERNRLQTSVKNYDKYTIFEMTHSPKNYEKYTPIPAMYADNDAELKEKVNTWLEYIISIINEPLCQCPQCEGVGYLLQDKIAFTEGGLNE